MSTDWMPVLTKRDMASRYKQGEFGNASPTWFSRHKFVNEASLHGKYHLRNKVTGGDTYYNLSKNELLNLWDKVSDPESFYVSAMAPHSHGTIQGELMQGPEGLELFYASAKLPMREALKAEGKTVKGLVSLGMLKTYLWPCSYEWIMTLLERYPEHVVEFTAFSIEWGTVHGHNCVVWEVRLY